MPIRHRLLASALMILLLPVSWAQPRPDGSPAAMVAPETPPVNDAASAPPPTIADLVLLLRSYKPDQQRVNELRTLLEEPVPGEGAPADLARAWHKKALIAEELQQIEKRTEYLENALPYARQANLEELALGGLQRIRFEYATSLWYSKSVAASQESTLELALELEKSQRLPPLLLTLYFHVITNYVHLGDLDSARLALGKADALYRQLSRRPQLAMRLPHFSSLLETARGFVLLREGKLDEAERAYLAASRQGERNAEYNVVNQRNSPFDIPMDRIQTRNNSTRLFLARALIQQQRLNEAEVLLREILKSSLVLNGRNSFITGRALWTLSLVFTNRGRHAEAAVLAQWADRSLQEAGFSETSPARLNGRTILANALTAAGRADEAVALYDAIRAKVGNDSRLEEGFGQGSLLSIRAYILAGRINDALRDGDNLLRHTTRNFGASHYNTAEARAYRAMALQRAGRVDEARKEFAAAVPILTDPDKVVGKQNASIARTTRLRLILNEYLNVLVGNKGNPSPADMAEAFRVADVARWQSVQKALAGSALRAAAGSPELGARIKKVQDADDELQAVYKNLITQRSAPPEQQLPTVIKAMEQRIADLQKEQQRDLVEIRRQFPQYDELVNPRPANLATARRALRPKEALLSIYVTPGGSYVWATGPQGDLQFHFSPQKPDWVAAQVKRLRDSVDLTTGISPDRLRFDLEAGAALYQELLAPVQGAWAQADTLLVVANDTLGQIPFSLLPTGASPAAQATPGLPMSQYRQVPWLARQVAVAYLPSVSALVTLRALPASQGKRDPFVGFGDPDFGAQTDGGSTRGVGSGTRNLKIKRTAAWDESQTSADAPVAAPPATPEAPTLTALPDTRDEITAIATAMAADLRRDTFFGAQANRQNVLASDLKQRRIVAFATHGLVAGDLPGLDQPALALSPAPGKTITDGLLKLEDILKLSLDADLVVLSACNTAAADGTGAEAVSGLGRGFFYAGARSVLATHWPVETVSARELVTHLFERYAKDAQLTRAQALNRAMLDLIDT
ncbi:MAG: CHAT domain-containing protein, partial [Hylemonella sp.]|nr:CHAT domain-containing protein [Hylemonella sp.]